MPLVSPIDIAVLSSPIPLPGETSTVTPGSFDASTQQNFTAITKGSGVTSPIGTGNEMMPSQTFNTAAEYGNIEGKALESGGANVGGLVKTEQEVIPTDIKFATAEDEQIAKQEDQFEDQVDEYKEAFDSGTEAEAKLREDESGLQTFARRYSQENIFVDPGMERARGVKRADRKADRKARKEAGLTGKAKRKARKAQRQQRRDSFKAFKDELDLEAQQVASNLE
jgi:hypothetical protein